MSPTPTLKKRAGSTAAPEYARTDKISIDETEAVAWLCRAKTGPVHVMLDVGAHFGSSAEYFHKLGWSIHCFEPDSSNRQKLKAKLGRAPNVTIDPRAVSDEPAIGVSFFRSDESTGISGLHAFRETHVEDGRVNVTTVAEIVKARSIQRVDFLKIDVEGLDFKVIKGVPWDNLIPSIVECEFEDRKTVPLGHTYEDVAQYLVDKGYTVYLSEWHPITRYGTRHDWRRVVPFPTPRLADDAWGNILAFRDDPGLTKLQAAFDTVISKLPQRSATKAFRPLRYTQLNNPLLEGIGSFGLWCLRKARDRPRVSFLALLVPVVLMVSAIGTKSDAGRLWLALAAVASVGLLGSAALDAFMISKLRRRLYVTDQRLVETESLNSDIRCKLIEFESRFAAMQVEIGKLQDSAASNLAKFQRFKRHLTDQEINTLIVEWGPSLGLELNCNRLSYLAYRAATLESLMKGRLATPIETIVLRILVCLSVKRKDIEVCEIGTLFGVGAAALYDAASNDFALVHLTLIDPLDGYYGEGRRDVLTGIHVTEAVLSQNLSVGQVPIDDYTVIKRLSEDKQSIADAARREYDVLIIDGDHSRAGVKRDFDNYITMLRPGGYVIFDDYGTDHWPDIQRYVDEEVEGSPGLERVGVGFRTAVYRVLTKAGASSSGQQPIYTHPGART